MNYSIKVTETFEKAAKALNKKYPSFKEDMALFYRELQENPLCGVNLGGNIRKIRVAIASKNKGKRSGARIIAFDVYANINEKDIYLITIYDKNEKETITSEEILHLLKSNGLG